MGNRADQLASRIEQSGRDLIAFVESLTDEQWKMPCPEGDNRQVGVIVNHVGSVFPVEVHVAKTLAEQGGMPDLVWQAVHDMNAGHATSSGEIDKTSTIELIRTNSQQAAAEVRSFTDEQLDRVAPTNLHWGAPMTVQFWIESHPIAHGYIHAEAIRAAIGASS